MYQTDYGTIVLCARYTEKVREPWLTPMNIEYYKKLPIVGNVWSTEHFWYDEIPGMAISPGDRIIRFGYVLLTSVLQTVADQSSRIQDLQYANSMVLKRRYTGEIYEVELIDYVEETPKPYVEVEFKLRKFRKPKCTEEALPFFFYK